MGLALDRRHFILSAATATVCASVRAAAAAERPVLARVIADNDFAGDPDGLFQLAHHLLCPSIRIPLIVGSHLPARFSDGRSAAAAAAKAGELIRILGQERAYRPIAGSERPITSRAARASSGATASILHEAMRSDANGPLVYAAGAGLTELALAWMAEPRIGRRIKLVWIGGNEHPGLATPPPGPAEPEFNFTLDPVAAQIIFNESDIEIWQVPRDAYRQMLFSTAELDELSTVGPLGRYLKSEVDGVADMLAKVPGMPPIVATDAYVLGDSPLVTLTALVPPIQPDPSSSRYVALPTPFLADDGSYRARPSARPMRVYTAIDAGLTFRDMTARFRSFSARAVTGFS